MERKHILVIDDDLGIRVLLTKLLENAGYSVGTAEEGQSGMESAWSTRPDLVITDMNMPVIDGFHTMHMFSQDPSLAVPIIVVSGAIDIRQSAEVLEAGAAAFFQKPVDGQALLAKVGELLNSA
jgi:CheY-like chemotaxis protein